MPNSLIRRQDTLDPTLLAFTPRQVLLLPNNMTQTNPITSSDLKSPLIHAVAGFLQAKGFSKTLKKFLSEASIEKNGMKDSLLDLEVMFHKYAEMCNKDKTSVSNQKENGNVPAPESDAKSKDKKKDKNKGNKVSDTSNSIELESELPRATKENVKDHTSVTSKDVDDFEAEQRSKDNNKMKKKSNDSNQTSETIANGNLLDVKPKIKKSKKGSSGGEGKKVSVVEDASDTFLTKEDVKISDVDATGKEDESSKKRKRCYSEKNDSEPVKNKEFESDEKSSMPKRIKKQQNDSTEPKTVKTFQRVKAEEVVFTDEKLKDNSYWAKDGAEIGYGAKAQEVLGQVRGRDFRHEKTKKKRGSYRGGQIDLQSHSVKFNYSDEE